MIIIKSKKSNEEILWTLFKKYPDMFVKVKEEEKQPGEQKGGKA